MTHKQVLGAIVITCAAIIAVCLNSCGLFTPAIKTKALPSVDFLTLSEVRDTSYCNVRTAGRPFDGAFYDARDSAFNSVQFDSVYSCPLFDFDKMRVQDSLGILSTSFYQREKSILITTYNVLKGGRQ